MQILNLDSQFEPALPEVELPAYVPPAVTTYTDEQLLEALGPVRAAYVS